MTTLILTDEEIILLANLISQARWFDSVPGSIALKAMASPNKPLTPVGEDLCERIVTAAMGAHHRNRRGETP